MPRRRRPDEIIIPQANNDNIIPQPPTNDGTDRKKKTKISPREKSVVTLDTYEWYLGMKAIGPMLVQLDKDRWAVRNTGKDGTGLHKYQMVVTECQALKCKDKVASVWTCSCEDMSLASGFLTGFQSHLHTSREILQHPLFSKPCLHIQVMQRLHEKQSPLLLNKLPQDSKLIRDGIKDAPFLAWFNDAFISADKSSNLKCLDPKCKYAAHKCDHTLGYASWIRHHNLENQEPFTTYVPTVRNESKPVDHKESEEIPAGVSSTKVPVDRWSNGAKQRIKSNPPSMACIPDTGGCCPKCAAIWDARNPVEMNWVKTKTATVYGLQKAYKATVYFRKCSKCDEEKQYDGRDDGIFNFSNSSLFEHETMMMFVDSIVECKMPFNAYHGILERAYERSKCSLKLCDVKTLTRAMKAFIRVVDMDYKGAFECPICAQYDMDQRVVVMDGKVMGFRLDLMVRHEPHSVVFIPKTKEKLASMLRKYARGDATIDVVLLRRLVAKYKPSLLPLIPYGPTTCPPEYRYFLGSLAREYGVNGISLKAAELFRDLCETPQAVRLSADHLEVFEKGWPALHDLLQNSGWTEQLPGFLVHLLTELVEKITNPCSHHHHEQCKSGPQMESTSCLAYINSRKAGGVATMLRNYAKGKGRDVNVEKLVKGLKKCAPNILPLVPRDKDVCPEGHRVFLASIATDYPIKDTTTRAAANVVRTILKSQDKTISVDQRAVLELEWPALFDLLSKCKWMSALPPTLVPLLEDLVALVLDIVPEPKLDPAEPHDQYPENPLSHFPNFPLCRPSLRVDHNDLSRGKWCTKRVQKSKNTTPGMFALFCPHGICLGYEAMSEYEGPLTAADILYRRFPTPPGIVIYDNACALSRVCVKNAPAHFGNVKYLIDRLHWCGHTACHTGYYMGMYDNWTVLGGTLKLSQINSQVCEQANSKMELIRSQTKSMNQETYMSFTKLFLALYNMNKMKK